MHHTYSLRVMIVSLILVSTMTSMFSVSAKGGPFADVDSTSTYAKALTYLKAKEILTGYDDGTFQPEKSVNRAEALKMLLSGLKIQIYPQTKGFSDVDAASWYGPFVLQALKNGYVKGYPDGTFKPDRPVNRVEAMKMLLEISGAMKTMPLTGKPTITVDASNWYAPYVQFALDKNLIRVYDESQLRPGDGMNRGDIAEMLYRYLSIKDSGQNEFQDYETGKVSYYDPKLAGKNTSSGEPYKQSSFTAAHRDVAFGTMLQVVDEAKKQSVLVRVNDRGPYTEGHVVDLSEAAFEEVSSLSRGVFDAKVYPVGMSTFDKSTIASTAFPGLTLGNALPNMMSVDELYMLPVAGSSSCELRNPTGHVSLLEQQSIGSQAYLELHFPQEGLHMLSCAGVTKEIMVAPLYSKPIQTLPSGNGDFRLRAENDHFVFSWNNPSSMNINMLEFSQGVVSKRFIVNNAQQVLLHADEFTGLSDGKWTIKLYGAQTSTGFSHDRSSAWAYLGSMEPSFITAMRSVFLDNDLALQVSNTTNTVRVGETVTFTGTTKTKLRNLFFALNHDGRIEKKKIIETAGDILSEGTSFSLSYPIPAKGSYIFEFIRADAKPVYLDRFQTDEVYVVPKPRLDESQLSADALRTMMVNWVGEDRKRLGLRGLELDGTLVKIAQSRSDDIVANNYFSHYTKDNKTVNELKITFQFAPNISENLAFSTEGVFAAYLELRHSPSHLENMYQDDIEIAGFGFTRKGTEMYVVQEFATKPVAALKVADIRTTWIEKLRSEGHLLTLSEPMSTAAQSWAQELTNRSEVTFSIGDRTLIGEMTKAGGTGAYAVQILLKDTMQGAETRVLESLRTFADGAQVGLGVVQDQSGVIRIVIGVKN